MTSRRRLRVRGAIGTALALRIGIGIGPAAAADEGPASGLPAPDSREREPLPSGVAELLLRERPACDYRDHIVVEGDTFVACGDAGLWIVLFDDDGTAALERRDVGASVIGLSRAGAVVLPVLGARGTPPNDSSRSGSDAPRGEGEGSGEPRPAAPPAKEPPAEFGRVVSVDGTTVRVVVLEGRPAVGDRVEFLADGRLPVIGEVERVDAGEVLVVIGTNERVDGGFRAEFTQRAVTRDVAGPPVSDASFVVAAMVRPWFGGASGSGLLMNGTFEARLDWMRIALDVGPVNAPLGGSVAVGSAALRWGASTRYFEGGLGVGVSTVSRDFRYPTGTGLLFAPYFRLGAEDGFMLRVDGGGAIFHSENYFAYLNALLQVPIHQRVALTVGGGGGLVGYTFFEAGARVLAVGGGGVGSWFFRGTLGYLGVDAHLPSSFSEGPFLGFGAEHRF